MAFEPGLQGGLDGESQPEAAACPQVAQLMERARQQAIPDALIGSCRIVAVGDAWQHEGYVRALQLLLQQRGLDQLALVGDREPWYRRLWAQLWGPAEA